jgi:type I restriction enzyme R subunit
LPSSRFVFLVLATPEQQSRQQIDAMLEASGWVVQDYKKLNPSAARGIAIREVPLKTGPCDYLLLVDRNPVGVIEAKRLGLTLSTVAEQSSNYAANLPDFLAALCPADIAKLPFAYESTSAETLFRDERDPHPRSRRVFSFHRPETLAAWLDAAATDPAHPTLRARLAAMPA